MEVPHSQHRRASVWEWSLATLLGVQLAGTTLGLGGYPAGVRVATSGFTVAMVAVCLLGRAFDPRLAARRWHPAGWLPVPFLIYAAGNCAWVSPVPWLAWRDWFDWLQLAAVFWVVVNGVGARGPRRLVFGALVAVALVGVVLGCYQCFARPDWAVLGRVRPPEYAARASGSFAIPNSFAGLLLLLLPIAGVLAWARGRSATVRVWWMWVSGVLLLGLALTVSRGAWLAAGLACLAWPFLAGVGRRRWRRTLGIAAIAAVGVTLALGAAYRQVPGARDRVASLVSDGGERSRTILWDAAWKLFRANPWFGTGGGSYNVSFERHRPEQFPDTPLYAHNDYLNTLSDYGTVGFLLGAGGVALALVGAGRGRTRSDGGRGPSDGDLAGAAGIGLLAFALHLGVEFHLKIPALGLAASTLAGLALRARWSADAESAPPAEAPRWRRLRALGAAAMVFGAWGAWVAPAFRAEAIRFEARTMLDSLAAPQTSRATFADAVRRARAALDEAVRIDPTHAAAWADLAFATGLAANVTPEQQRALGQEAELQARRALALSAAPAESWIRLGTALNLRGDWAGASRAYLHATVVAPHDANAWYYYADHLSRVFALYEATDAALRVCLRLDPGNPAGLALRQRLALTKKTP